MSERPDVKTLSRGPVCLSPSLCLSHPIECVLLLNTEICQLIIMSQGVVNVSQASQTEETALINNADMVKL